MATGYINQSRYRHDIVQEAVSKIAFAHEIRMIQSQFQV